MAQTTVPVESRPLIRSICGNTGQVFTATMARIYEEDVSHEKPQWQDLGLHGPLLFMKDFNGQFMFRLVDLNEHKITWQTGLLGKQEYIIDCDFFHILHPVDDSPKYGISFVDASEAKQFYQIVQKKRTVEEDDILISRKPTLDEIQPKMPSNLKKSSSAISKNQISVPKGFRHVSHVGLDTKQGTWVADNAPVEMKKALGLQQQDDHKQKTFNVSNSSNTFVPSKKIDSSNSNATISPTSLPKIKSVTMMVSSQSTNIPKIQQNTIKVSDTLNSTRQAPPPPPPRTTNPRGHDTLRRDVSPLSLNASLQSPNSSLVPNSPNTMHPNRSPLLCTSTMLPKVVSPVLSRTPSIKAPPPPPPPRKTELIQESTPNTQNLHQTTRSVPTVPKSPLELKKSLNHVVLPKIPPPPIPSSHAKSLSESNKTDHVIEKTSESISLKNIPEKEICVKTKQTAITLPEIPPRPSTLKEHVSDNVDPKRSRKEDMRIEKELEKINLDKEMDPLEATVPAPPPPPIARKSSLPNFEKREETNEEINKSVKGSPPKSSSPRQPSSPLSNQAPHTTEIPDSRSALLDSIRSSGGLKMLRKTSAITESEKKEKPFTSPKTSFEEMLLSAVKLNQQKMQRPSVNEVSSWQ